MSRAALLALLALAACGRGGDGDGDDRRGGEHVDARAGAWKDGHRPSTRLGDLPSVEPLWQVRLPREPGVTVMRSVAGPAVGAGAAVMGATGLGWAAVEIDTGALRWHLPGEERPGSVEWSGDGFVVRGECAHVDEPKATACAQTVDARSGEVVSIAWGETPATSPDEARVTIDDEVLRGPGWESDDRFHAVARAGSDDVVAIRLTGGIGPVTVAVADGRVTRAADTVEALLVLDHVVTFDGGVALAVRLDSTLYRDAIVAFDPAHRLRWAWAIPRPAAPRVDGVSIASTDRGVVAFYDGQLVAHLGVGNSDTVSP